MILDTRSKIVTPSQAVALAEESRHRGEAPVVFVTHMEVLRASHVQELEELAATSAGPLFVILTEPESPLVPLDARAELAAALRAVDYVVPSPEGAGPVLAAIQASVTVEDEEEDRGRTRQLMEHVRSRSRV